MVWTLAGAGEDKGGTSGNSKWFDSIGWGSQNEKWSRKLIEIFGGGSDGGQLKREMFALKKVTTAWWWGRAIIRTIILLSVWIGMWLEKESLSWLLGNPFLSYLMMWWLPELIRTVTKVRQCPQKKPYEGRMGQMWLLIYCINVGNETCSLS